MRSRSPAVLVLALGTAAALRLAPPAHGVAGSWYENPHSQVRLVTPYTAAARSGPFQLGIQFKLAPDWHAYWRNSGDAGFPPSFDFRQTPQLVAPTVAWPAPHRYAMPGDLVAFGYADEVVYPVHATLQATGDVLRIVATADYLVCAVECVPYRYDLQVDQPLAPPGAEVAMDPEIQPLLAAWQARVPAAPAAGAFDAALRRAGDGFELEVAFAGAATDLIPDTHPLFEIGPPSTTRANDRSVFVLPLARKDTTAELPKTSAFRWVVTGPAVAVDGGAELPLPRRSSLLPIWMAGVLIALIASLAARRRRRAQRPLNHQPEGDHRS